VVNDFRLAVRLLGKERGFTAAAIVVLGLGIAVTNTAFTLVNGVLLRDLPFADPDRVVDLGDASYLEVQDWRAAARTLEDIAAVREQAMNVSDDDMPAERVRGAYVSGHAFALLGRRPLLGRDLRPDDSRVGAPSVVILGHNLWRTRYRSEPAILGRTIRFNGAPSTVIGVMPDGFEFPLNARLWQPLAALPSGMRDDRSARLLDGFGRLRGDASRERSGGSYPPF
jgi:putative ABC transport system permease protein